MFGACWQAADGGVLQLDSPYRSKYSFEIIQISGVICFLFPFFPAFFIRGPSLLALASLLSLQSKKQPFTRIHSKHLRR